MAVESEWPLFCQESALKQLIRNALAPQYRPTWLNDATNQLAERIARHLNEAAAINPINLVALALLLATPALSAQAPRAAAPATRVDPEVYDLSLIATDRNRYATNLASFASNLTTALAALGAVGLALRVRRVPTRSSAPSVRHSGSSAILALRSHSAMSTAAIALIVTGPRRSPHP